MKNLLVCITIEGMLSIHKIICITIFFVLLQFPSPLFAQGNTSTGGIANYVDLEEAVQEGDIIVLANGLYKKSSEPYQFKIVGVVTQNPAVALDYSASEQPVAVAASGVNQVKVTGENGPIKEGDYITTSSQSGLGMKATEAGYVLGMALQDFPGQTGADIAVIPVSLEVDFSYNPAINSGEGKGFENVWDIFTMSSTAVYQSPSVVFRYALAAFVLIFSVLLGFLTFSRVASNGIAAIGRNPMAGKLINISIILNVVLTLFIIAIGADIAYAIITF